MLLLCRNGLLGSAFALGRSIVESMYRGMWINFCATDAQLAEFNRDDRFPVKMPQMAREIDVKYRAGRVLRGPLESKLGGIVQLYPHGFIAAWRGDSLNTRLSRPTLIKRLLRSQPLQQRAYSCSPASLWQFKGMMTTAGKPKELLEHTGRNMRKAPLSLDLRSLFTMPLLGRVLGRAGTSESERLRYGPEATTSLRPGTLSRGVRHRTAWNVMVLRPKAANPILCPSE